jgi:hypothetical protein
MNLTRWDPFRDLDHGMLTLEGERRQEKEEKPRTIDVKVV